MVFQIQLTKRVDAVPITREYMHRPVALASRSAGPAASPQR